MGKHVKVAEESAWHLCHVLLYGDNIPIHPYGVVGDMVGPTSRLQTTHISLTGLTEIITCFFE